MCGDGLNLGGHECDDGNLQDGDGCSHKCTVEKGYRCYKQAEGPDECTDIAPPEAAVKVIRGNTIVVSFNELVFPTHSSNTCAKE